MKIMQDLTGKVFGRWTVVGFSGRTKSGKIKWDCVCECGNRKAVSGCSLRGGRSISCGCFRVENQTKHGLCGTPEYIAWERMNARCNNPKDQSYEYYGGRGITICKEWSDFSNFLSDMGERPSNKHSIDRIDNDKGYNRSNCKWSTKTEQNRNRRNLDTATGATGVCWVERRKRYQSQISVCGRPIYIGYFKDIEDAIAAREKAEQKYWGKAFQE